MNIAIRPENINTQQELAGKVSLVTGSTSGSDWVLLGPWQPPARRWFSTASASRKMLRMHRKRSPRSSRSGYPFARGHVEPRGHSGHDPRHPAIVRPARHSREQCWHPACGALAGIPTGKVGRHLGRQPVVGLSYDAAGAAFDAPEPVGSHHQYCVRAWPGGIAVQMVYVAAKHGLVGLTKVTALETAEQGITCNAICPGYVYTPLVEAQIGAQAKAHGIRATRSSATFCSRSSRTNVSPRSKSWARLPFFLQARPRLRSPA